MCDSCEPQYFKLGNLIPPELHLQTWLNLLEDEEE